MQTEPPDGAKHTPEPWYLLPMVEIEPSLSGGSASRQQRYPIFKKDGAYASPAEALTQADGERIVQCINACAGIADPAAHITGLENQLEAWETSAKLRDDGLCPTQREVIADQQAQIERMTTALESLLELSKGESSWCPSSGEALLRIHEGLGTVSKAEGRAA